MTEVLNMPLGCATMITKEGHLVKKPTGWMTNAPALAKELAKPCSGDHRHVVLIGGNRARRAQVYPNELCKAIIYFSYLNFLTFKTTLLVIWLLHTVAVLLLALEKKAISPK